MNHMTQTITDILKKVDAESNPTAWPFILFGLKEGCLHCLDITRWLATPQEAQHFFQLMLPELITDQRLASVALAGPVWYAERSHDPFLGMGMVVYPQTCPDRKKGMIVHTALPDAFEVALADIHHDRLGPWRLLTDIEPPSAMQGATTALRVVAEP